MNILWFTWKDRQNPASGGAELLNEEHAKRLARDGHKVIFLVAGFKGGKDREQIKGYKVIRVGNRWTVYWHAYRYYKKHLQNWPEMIVEEINTVPFFTQFYASQRKVLYIYQLCREIWFHEIFFPVNIIGYILEPIYLWLLRKNTVFTESQSTKLELLRYGFRKEKIHIIPPATEVKTVRKFPKKYSQFTLLSIGTIRSMKQTLHHLKAFESAKHKIPSLKLKIAGQAVGEYGRSFLKRLELSPFARDIEYLGKVSEQEKQNLFIKSHLVLQTAVKEGWGLTITEAAACATPTIAYNSDGLRDAVKHNLTGLITFRNTPHELARNIVQLFNNSMLYKKLQKGCLSESARYSYEKSYHKFFNILNEL